MILDSSCFDIEATSNPGWSLSSSSHSDWKTAKKGFEAAYVRQLLRRHGGSVYKAAQAARIAPRSLYKILERLGVQPGPRSGGPDANRGEEGV